MLAVEGLVKRFGDLTAVDGVSFQVQDGECFGLLGPNGAGKTTTISMIAGIAKPDRGSISVDGFSSSDNLVEVKRRIGFVPQELALYQEIDARENLRFFAALYGIFGKAADSRIGHVLELVGLSDRAKEPISNFSGGMKRRLNIGAGLLHDPKLLIFDEPTVGVDPQSRNAIFETLENLRKVGKTILYTTHYMEEVERLCQTVAIMDHGHIVASGELNALKNAEGGRNEVVLDLKLPLDQGGESVLNERFRIEFQGTRVVVTLEEFDSGLPLLIDSINSAGGTIIAIKSSESSLEQVFLRTTGRTLRD